MFLNELLFFFICHCYLHCFLPVDSLSPSTIPYYQPNTAVSSVSLYFAVIKKYLKARGEDAVLQQMRRAHKLLSVKSKFSVVNGRIK